MNLFFFSKCQSNTSRAQNLILHTTGPWTKFFPSFTAAVIYISQQITPLPFLLLPWTAKEGRTWPLQAAQRKEGQNAKLTLCENVTLSLVQPLVLSRSRGGRSQLQIFSFPEGGNIKCCSQARGSFWELRVLHPPFWWLDIMQVKILHHKLWRAA